MPSAMAPADAAEDAAEAVLATQLGLVSAQAGFEAMINEKEYGKSNIKVEWESGLSLIITDNIFNGKPFELNLNMGVKVPVQTCNLSHH